MDIGGSGGQSFPFENYGDTVTGEILDMEEVQRTDVKTGEPLTWPDGKPQMQYRVTLQTDLAKDADDDGQRTVYLRGSRKPDSQSSLAAVLGAVKAATGGTDVQVGGKLTLTFTGEGVASNRAFNAPKQYAATYVAPGLSLDPPAPPASPAGPVAMVSGGSEDPVVGKLGTNTVTASKKAAMEAAGMDLSLVPGWVPA